MTTAVGLLLLAGCATPLPPPGVTSAWRVGPLLEGARNEAGDKMLAVRPFYSRETSAQKSRGVVDLLWPLGTFSHRDGRSNWRLLLAYGTGNDSTLDNEAYRFRLFPIYFEGRTRAGDEYRALFPLYGEIRDFIGLGDVNFCLFPLYARALDRETEMRTLLWPFYLTRHGPKIEQLRLWPFYGKRRTTGGQANTRTFVLWPIWHRLEMESDAVRGSAFMLFPLYGRSRFERQHRGSEQGWWLIPPLIGHIRGDDGYRSLRAPWPFIRQLDDGARRERHWWPLYGSRVKEERSSWYALWPLVSGLNTSNDTAVVNHFRITPFYLQERCRAQGVEKADSATLLTTAKGNRSYRRLWPLFSWQQSDHGSRVRVPELSLFHRSEPIERNWAPLWSFFIREQRSDGALITDIFWGLAAWGRDAESRRILQLLWLFNFKGRTPESGGERAP